MKVQETVDKHGNARENLLQILHDLQDASGDNSLHQDTLQDLSQIMDIPVADIVGTATFYTMFSLAPRGKHIIRICVSPPCHIMGEENIADTIREKLNIDFGETSEDGLFTLEESSCLGACGVAPVISIDDEVYGNLTREKVERILDDISG